MAENERTPKQQIAELQAKIARLKAKETALENGQKIILSGMRSLQLGRISASGSG